MINIDPQKNAEPVKEMFKSVKSELERILEEQDRDSGTGFVLVEKNGERELKGVELNFERGKIKIIYEKKNPEPGEDKTVEKEIQRLEPDFENIVDHYNQNKEKALALGYTHPPSAECLDVFDAGFESISFGDYLGYMLLEEGGMKVPKLVAYLDDEGEVAIEGYWKGKPLKTQL